MQAALIRWGGEKPMTEYRFEHSLQHETIKRRNKIKLEISEHETSPVVYSDDPEEAVTGYTHYVENGKE